MCIRDRGKVIHADVDVAIGDEACNGIPQHADALFAGGQIGGFDAPLRFEAVGQVRIGIQRDA